MLAILTILLPLSLLSMNNDQSQSSKLALQRLSGAIKIQTVSYKNDQPEKQSEFHQKILQFHQYLEQTFPKVHQHLTKQTINNYSLLYTWQGQDTAAKPALLMAHMDVVPVDEDPNKSWNKDPFSGDIDERYIYGRGTIDIKTPLIAMLHVIEEMLENKNYQPKRTYYLAFGHDEEIGGKEGNKKISEYLQSQNVQLSIVVDEGGAVMTNAVQDVSIPLALVGIAEKGFANVKLSIDGQGGHASMPPTETIPGILAKAICAIEQHQMPPVLSGPTRLMLEHLAPHMPFGKKLIMENLWATERLVKYLFAQKEVSNATVRTTIAPTIIQSGCKDNVLPSSGNAILNCRLLPENSKNNVIQFIKDVVNDPRVKVEEVDGGWEASPVSNTKGASFNFLKTVIQKVFPNVPVVPYLVVGGTDARYYASLSDSVFRFAPYRLDNDELKLMHGVNEKLSCENVTAAINFYKEFIANF